MRNYILTDFHHLVTNGYANQSGMDVIVNKAKIALTVQDIHEIRHFHGSLNSGYSSYLGNKVSFRNLHWIRTQANNHASIKKGLITYHTPSFFHYANLIVKFDETDKSRQVTLEQKGVDVLLAVNALALAHSETCRIVLCTNDTDFSPLVDQLISEGIFVLLINLHGENPAKIWKEKGCESIDLPSRSPKFEKKITAHF